MEGAVTPPITRLSKKVGEGARPPWPPPVAWALALTSPIDLDPAAVFVPAAYFFNTIQNRRESRKISEIQNFLQF